MSSGQSITDRALAAKHTVAGQSVAKSVCKATTEEVMGPKRKHLEYLLHCTNEANVSIPQVANLLIERTQNASWVVVFKALVTIHNLMNYGNERFSQYLASSNCTFNLYNFYDRSNGMQGYGMSTFIRRYAKYLNQKAYSYRQMAFDFCRAKRGKDDGTLRTMNSEQLLKALPILQTQFDALIEFDVTAAQMTNGIISAAFMLLFKDLIRLYACYNDGIINLLGQYFDMGKKSCREAFEIYKLFIARVDKVSSFFKIAESVGVDKGDIPDLAKAPASLLEALEQHLYSLENTKKTLTTKPAVTHAAAEQPRASPAVPAETAVPASMLSSSAAPATISDADRKRILEEEQRMLDMIKQEKLKAAVVSRPMPVNAASALAAESTFLASNVGRPPDIVGGAQKPAAVVQPQFNPFNQLDPGFDLPPIPPSYDLLALQHEPSLLPPSSGVPFLADDNLFFSSMGAANPPPAVNAGSNKIDPFSQSSFAGLDDFRTTSTTVSPLGQTQLTPASVTGAANPPALLSNNHVLPAGQITALTSQDKKMITTDLDASLASIAGNLNIRTPDHYRRMDHQWSGPSEKRMTGTSGGNAWTQPSPSHAAFSGIAMQPSMVAPQNPAMMTAYPVSMGQPGMLNPMTGMMPTSQSPVMFASQPYNNSSVGNTASVPHTNPANDPFGLF